MRKGDEMNTETHKVCRNCETLKERSEFYKNKARSDGIGVYCKPCENEKKKERKERDPELHKQKVREYSKKWRDANPEKVLEKSKKYRENNREKIRARYGTQEYRDAKNRYNAENRERKNEISRKSYAKNKEAIAERRKAKRGQINAAAREYYHSNAEHKLATTVRTAIRKALKGQRKSAPTFEALPYTPAQLKEHIESQFEDWMTWDNYGLWHIDHIYPQSKLPYDSLEHPNFQKCWALENLRPLDAIENIKKGAKI